MKILLNILILLFCVVIGILAYYLSIAAILMLEQNHIVEGALLGATTGICLMMIWTIISSIRQNY